MDNFNTKQHKKPRYSFTLTQFKQLITKAQTGNEAAIKTLCKAFTPLIYKEAYRSNIRENLGDDAVNTAWLIFLEFIRKYNGRDYSHLPGLIHYHLRYELLHKISRYSSIQKYDSIDLITNDGESLQIADTENVIEQFENRQQLLAALDCLTAKQKKVIIAIYFQGYSLQEYSELQAVSYKTVYLHYQRALAKLKKLLT